MAVASAASALTPDGLYGSAGDSTPPVGCSDEGNLALESFHTAHSAVASLLAGQLWRVYHQKAYCLDILGTLGKTWRKTKFCMHGLK